MMMTFISRQKTSILSVSFTSSHCPSSFYQYTSPYQECEQVTELSIPLTGPHSLVLPMPKPPPSNRYDNIEDDIGLSPDIA
jgi:hypothetical protein